LVHAAVIRIVGFSLKGQDFSQQMTTLKAQQGHDETGGKIHSQIPGQDVTMAFIFKDGMPIRQKGGDEIPQQLFVDNQGQHDGQDGQKCGLSRGRHGTLFALFVRAVKGLGREQQAELVSAGILEHSSGVGVGGFGWFAHDESLL